jgi:hypothetical protein
LDIDNSAHQSSHFSAGWKLPSIPLIDERFVNLLEVLDALEKSSPNDLLRQAVPTLSDPLLDALDGHFNARQSEIY